MKDDGAAGGGAGAADAGAREKAASILSGLEKFLDGLARRDPKASSQTWVATTYLTLGSGKGTGAAVPKAKADQYLDRAADVYKKLLEKNDAKGAVIQLKNALQQNAAQPEARFVDGPDEVLVYDLSKLEL